MVCPVENDSEAWPKSLFPIPDELDVSFKQARRFNVKFGEAMLDRKNGLNTISRVAGLKRNHGQYPHIEVWFIEEYKPAALITVPRGTNTYYFEINRNDVSDELAWLADQEWEIEYIRDGSLYNSVPEEILPEDSVRVPMG